MTQINKNKNKSKKKNIRKKKQNTIKEEHKINYLCESWQYFLQQVNFMTNKGYYYYHTVNLPLGKKDKWLDIDKKLLEKYKMNKSKSQRAYYKTKGKANYYYYRCEGVAVMLKTNGDPEAGIVENDIFTDIRKIPLIVNVSTDIQLQIVINDNTKEKKTQEESFSVGLSGKSYNAIKVILEDVVKSTKNKKLIIAEFNKLNGLPAYSKMIKQKVELANWLIRCAKHHNLILNYDDFRINTFKPHVKNTIEEIDEKIDKAEEIEDSKNKKKTKSNATKK